MHYSLSFSSSFSSHTGEKQSVFKGSIDEIFQHQPKYVSKRLRQKVSPKLIKGNKKKGRGEGEGRWKLRGGGGLGSHVPREYIHAGEIYSTIHLLWLSHTHTHAHTLADTHTFSFHAEAGTHTPKHTHTLSQIPCDETVSSNLQSLLCAADGMAHGLPSPDRWRIKRTSKNQGAAEGGGQDQVDSGSLSPRQIPPAGSQSISRGVCSQGAPDYGKVIHLDALPPPPPTLGSLHWDDYQSCVCPRSTAFCSAPCCCKWGTVEARILIRWLATVSSRQSACNSACRLPRALCVCLRICICGESRESISGQKARWFVSCLGGPYHRNHHCPAMALSRTVFRLRLKKKKKKEGAFMIWKPRASVWMRESKNNVQGEKLAL